MIKLGNKWLVNSVKRDLKKRYPFLHNSFHENLRTECQKFLFEQPYAWILIVVFCLSIFFIVPHLHAKSLTPFLISIESVKSIIDQRIANIATIASVTFAVIGFLISNIALKESLGYRILFKHSWFHPIIYFVLSTLGCMVLMGLYKDHFLWTNERYYINSVFLTSYIFIIILILIGFLFKRLLIFTNDKNILNLLRTEVMDEAKFNLFQQLIAANAKRKLQSLLTLKGFSEIHLFDNLNGFTGVNNVNEEEEDLYVADVNILTLEKELSRIQEDGYTGKFSNLYIDKSVSLTSNIFWLQEECPNASNRVRKLDNSIFRSKKQSIKPPKETARKYLDENFEEAVKNSNLKRVSQYLDWYEELITLNALTIYKDGPI